MLSIEVQNHLNKWKQSQKKEEKKEGTFLLSFRTIQYTPQRAIRKMSARELLMNSFPLINNIVHTLHVTHNVFRNRNIHVHVNIV